MKKLPLLAALAGLLCVTAATAADLVVPNALTGTQSDTGNLFPFLSPQPVRYQQVYDRAQFGGFGGGAQYITQIAFRAHGPGIAFSGSASEIQINLSTTSATPDNLSHDFAPNVGPDDTVVYPKSALQFSTSVAVAGDGPQAFDIVITFVTPFLYDPARGNLLLDVRNNSGSSHDPANDQELDASSAAGDGTSRVYNFGDAAASTAGKTADVYQQDTFGLVTRFISTPVSPNGDPPHTLLNLSTRLRVETGDNVLIGGFIIRGGAKKVIVRAIGPSLTDAGVPDALANPTLELHGGAGELIFSNDDWVASPQKQEIMDSGVPPTKDQESAIVATLNPGNYTAIVRGVGETSGVALVETYDLDRTSAGRAVNLSTRGRVQTADNVMIGGFIIGGDQTTRVIVRALGPSLTSNGAPVPGRLGDPTLELRDAQGTLVEANNNWKDSAHKQEIMDSTLAPPNDLESAILLPLAPGKYTAVMRGANNTTGVGLVEIFNLD